MGKISTAMRHRVVILHEQGHFQAEISRRTGLSTIIAEISWDT